MGMQVDIYRTEKCLKGIEHGMTKKELVEYTNRIKRACGWK